MEDEHRLVASPASTHARRTLTAQLRTAARSWQAGVALLSATYFAFAKLGLLLAIPTIYASPFWPASGVALAGLLIFGYRAWPGVFISCLLLNINTVSVAAAASVAVGASMQALAGAFLVRRYIRFPSPLDEERDVIKLMLLGGPLTSWVSATCGVSTLIQIGFMPADDFAFNWWTWWIGDTIGVLVVTPLVLAWAGEPRESWQRRRVWITVPVCLASAIVVAFFVPASKWERARIEERFDEKATSIRDALQTSTNRYLEVLESVRDLHESSSELTWSEFCAFVAGPLARYPGFQAISWNPRIPDSVRGAHEKGLRDDGHDAGIMERDIEGQLIPAARRREYAFVRYIEPHEKNRPALGYDVASEPSRREALDQARDSGKAVATAPIQLVQDVRREPGVLVFMPAYRRGFPIENPEQRRANLIGYMTGVFRIPDVVSSSVKDLEQADLQVTLRDASIAPGKRPLYSNGPRSDPEPSTWAQLVKGRMGRNFDIDFSGRRWVLSILPAWSYIKRHRSWQVWTMLAGGMLFSGLIGAFLLVLTGRSTRLQALAGRLQLEATERSQAEEKVRRLNRVYAVLSGINALIVRVRDRKELHREACRIAVEAGKLRMAWLGVCDGTLMSVRPVAWHGHEDGFLGLMTPSLQRSAPEGLARQAIIEKRPIILNDIAHEEKFGLRQEALSSGYRSSATLPLTIDGKITGVLGLFASEPDFFDADEMRLLSELAGDISLALDHIQKAERLDYLAYYDPLTGLANRALFQERLVEHIRSADGRGRFAVCLVDVDRFKAINDAYGRQTGDVLLQQIGTRIADTNDGQGRPARISADRFALVIPDVRNEDDVARRLTYRLQAWFGPPFKLENRELMVSAKIGVAVFPSDGKGEEVLLANAEAALKKAKTTGDRYLFHTPEMTGRIAENLSRENKLRQALENEEFVLHYQPKVNGKTNRLDGVEALIRWQSPELGLVPPMQFIPLLEDTGLILDVGTWALRRAILDQREWVGRGLIAPRIAVNVSALQLRQRDFVAKVTEALREREAPGIDLELTESLLMDDMEGNIEKLSAIRALGVTVAIDDFGTGHSSLAYLAKLPVDTLKIDRSFITTMLNDPNTMSLVRMIISLAHSLKMTAIAEGVDAEEQARLLRLLRCDQMQGFLFSKPLTAAQLAELLVAGSGSAQHQFHGEARPDINQENFAR